MDIKALLAAFATGGADLGRRMDVRKKTDEEAARKQKLALLEESLLGYQVQAAGKAATAPPRPESPVRGTPQYEEMLDREAVITAKHRPPEAPRAPVRGTPEYLAAIEDEAKIEAKYRAPTGGGGGAEAAVDRRARDSYEAILLDINDTETKLKASPDAIGLKGLIPDIGLQRANPTGVQVRAAIANISSAIMLMRSGGAVSDAEFSRLEPMLPQDTDKLEAAYEKLVYLREFFRRKLATMGGGTGLVTAPAAPAPAGIGEKFRQKYGN